jgi:hypothetical protein
MTSMIAVTAVTIACENAVEVGPTADVADSNDAETGSALASADVTSYEIHHQQDTSTWQMANSPQSTPYRGIPWPGGTQGNIAEAGKPLKIVYERTESSYYVPPSRCYDETGGYYYDCPESYGYTQYVQFKTVEMQYRVDGGAIQTAVVTGSEYVQPEVSIDIPATAKGTLEYWFKLTRTNNNVEWDSRNGGNYHVNILAAPSATLTFSSTWTTSQSGDLRGGKTFRVNYDIARLRKEVRRALNVPENVGPVDFYIGAHISFDGATPVEVPVDFGGIAAFLPVVEIPADASGAEIWFRGWGRFGSNNTAVVFDSRYGENYDFDVN